MTVEGIYTCRELQEAWRVKPAVIGSFMEEGYLNGALTDEWELAKWDLLISQECEDFLFVYLEVGGIESFSGLLSLWQLLVPNTREWKWWLLSTGVAPSALAWPEAASECSALASSRNKDPVVSFRGKWHKLGPLSACPHHPLLPVLPSPAQEDSLRRVLGGRMCRGWRAQRLGLVHLSIPTAIFFLFIYTQILGFIALSLECSGPSSLSAHKSLGQMALPQWQRALSDLVFVPCSPNTINAFPT